MYYYLLVITLKSMILAISAACPIDGSNNDMFDKL